MRRKMSKPIADEEKIAITTWVSGKEYKELTDYCNNHFDPNTNKPKKFRDVLYDYIAKKLADIRLGKTVKL